MKNTKIKLALLSAYMVIGIFGIGCMRPRQKGLIFFNDFETIKGWTEAPNIVKTIKPHSGVFSYRIDSMHIYGLTLKLSFGEIFDHPIRKAKIKTWVYVNSLDAKGKIVMEVATPDKQIVLWIAKNIQDVVKETGKWTLMEMEFNVPANIYNLKNVIKVYPWNIGKKEIYVDDMEIEFVA